MNRKALKALAATILCALIIPEAPAAPGDLDKTFGKRGLVKTFLPVGTDITSFSRGLLVQGDGKIVVAVTTYRQFSQERTTALVRYNLDGSLDTTTSKDGVIASLAGEPASVVLQKDEKILVQLRDALFRFNKDGTPDTSFGTIDTGRVDAPASFTFASLVVQPDGKILVGDYGRKMARYLADGSLDTSFGEMGVVPGVTDGVGLALHLQTDGKILFAGEAYGSNVAGLPDLAVARYLADGTVDSSFGDGGISLINLGKDESWAEDVMTQSDQKIVLVGSALGINNLRVLVVVRLNPNGTLDDSFANGGIATLNAGAESLYASGVALQNDGKIIASAGAWIFRYNADGSLDRGFHGDGKLKLPGFLSYDDSHVALENDGGILVAAVINGVVRNSAASSNIGDRRRAGLVRIIGKSPEDVMVRKPDGSAYVGEDLYGVTGSKQKVAVELASNLGLGRQRNFAIKVRNNQGGAASFQVKGSPAEAGFRVQYFDSADVEITKDVVNGRYVLPELAGGAEAILTLRITAQRGAKPFATQRCRVLLKPEGAGNNADADAVVINAVNVSP